jgi:ureidoacrylate peracid hydrolase
MKTLQTAISQSDGQSIARRDVIGLAAGVTASVVTSAAASSSSMSKTSSVRAKRSVTIPAEPGPIGIDTAQTAVLVVDMQNDFGAKGGMFDLAGINISGIRAAIEPTSHVLAAARSIGLPIVYLKMGFLPNLSDMGIADSVNRVRHLQIMHVGKSVRAPDGRESRILIRDTWNTEILPELAPHAGDLQIYKTRFSGFYKTALDDELRKSGIKYLIVTGCTTSICVESTVRDAMFRDYLCVLLADCMSEPIGSNFERSNHAASLLTMQTLFGWVSDSRRFLRAIA